MKKRPWIANLKRCFKALTSLNYCLLRLGRKIVFVRFITNLTTIFRFGKAKNVTRVICPIPIYYVKLMCSLGSCSACSSPQLNCLLMIEIWYAYFLCVRGTQIWLKHSMNIKSFGSCIGDVTFPSTTAELKTTLLRHL